MFPQALVEFYLKTKDKNWKGKPLVADDPFMQFTDDGKQIRLFNPAKPLQGQEPFLVLPVSDVFSRDDESKMFPEMQRVARQTFLVLEKAWQLEGGTLVDLKVEFGFDAKGNLLLADVIDNDSWRVLEGGAYIDKQVYREGGALEDVAAKYRHVAEVTGHFHVPRQRIILWRGSDKDKTGGLLGSARRTEGHDDRRDLLDPQGAGQGRRNAASHVAGSAGHGGDRFHRPLERRGAGAVGAVRGAGDHRARQRQGFSRGCLVVVAGAEFDPGDDGAGARQRGARRLADSLRPQSSPLRQSARRDRKPDGQYNSALTGAGWRGDVAADKAGKPTGDGPAVGPAALLLAEIERLQADLGKAQRTIAELEARADVDPLLDILNRRGFERELKRSLAYLQRYNGEAVLLFIDLDGFKAVNDRHGHAAGDALLKAVARELVGHVRASDVVARLGGDEFGVLLWNLGAAQAAAKAHSLERLIEAVTVAHGEARIAVGASVGPGAAGRRRGARADDRCGRQGHVCAKERARSG